MTEFQIEQKGIKNYNFYITSKASPSWQSFGNSFAIFHLVLAEKNIACVQSYLTIVSEFIIE